MSERVQKALLPRMSVQKKLAVAFICLNIIDAALTGAIIHNGSAYECLPIMYYFITLEPAWIFYVVKAGIAAIVAVVLLLMTPRFPGQTERILRILVIAMMAICLVNAVALTIQNVIQRYFGI